MTKQLWNKIIWLSIFAVAMAFMESAVVIYLREIYYPNGFNFPLQAIDYKIGVTEIFREAATIIMLLSVGLINGRNRIEKFSFFIYLFAIWDIFYYVFLKIIISWPESLLTWDVLFLIPFTWTGPVIAPIINALTMIMIALLLLYYKEKYKKIAMFNSLLVWLIAGSCIILVSYMQAYVSFMISRFSFWDLFRLSQYNALVQYAQYFIPVKFNWILYFTGVTVQYIGVGQIIYRNK